MIKPTLKDITAARYVQREGKYYVRVYVSKKGIGGAIEFGWFDTKEEAKKFYKELRNLNN